MSVIGMLQHLAQQCLYVARELTSTREGAVHTKSPLTRKSFGRFHLISRPALNYAHGPERPGLSWPSTRTTFALVGPSHPFDFRRFRVLLVGSEIDSLNAHPLLQLGHESSKVLLTGIQDLAQFRAGLRSLLLRIPSFG